MKKTLKEEVAEELLAYKQASRKKKSKELIAEFQRGMHIGHADGVIAGRKQLQEELRELLDVPKIEEEY